MGVKFENIREGICYRVGDDALYKAIIKRNDWCLIMYYSYNSNKCQTRFINEEWWNTISDYVYEDPERLHYRLFDELSFLNERNLKSDWIFEESYG